MNRLQSRVYYDVGTGKVLLITGEMEGNVKENTKKEDMSIYPELKRKTDIEIDYIELEYGTVTTIFNNSKSYNVNLETKQLEVNYYTQEELDQIQQQNEKNSELNSRVSDVSTYLSNNTSTIADVEDLILQSEQNKIINGGI